MPEMRPHFNPPGHPAYSNATPSQLLRLNALAELHAEMSDRGFQEASVINLHPFPVYTSGPILRELVIERVPLDDQGWKRAKKISLLGHEVPYTQHVFTRWEPIILEQVVGIEGDFMGSVSRKAILPFTLAEDVVKQNNGRETRGGVICYKGNHPPLVNPSTREEELKLLEEAHQYQLNYYTAKFEEAEAAFSNSNSKLNRWKEFTYNRYATRYLRKMGIVAQDPKWLIKTQSVGAPAPQICVSCGAESKPGAIRCTNGSCTYVFNPFEAFNKYVIDLETPGAILALRRLNEEEIVKLAHAGRFTLEQLEEVGYAKKAEKKPNAKGKQGQEENTDAK